MLVEGTFLHRDELAGFWDRSVYLHLPFDAAAARMVARDEIDSDPDRGPLARYAGAQRLYFAACAPWRRASVVVDATGGLRVVDADDVGATAGR